MTNRRIRTFICISPSREVDGMKLKIINSILGKKTNENQEKVEYNINLNNMCIWFGKKKWIYRNTTFKLLTDNFSLFLFKICVGEKFNQCFKIKLKWAPPTCTKDSQIYENNEDLQNYIWSS